MSYKYSYPTYTDGAGWDPNAKAIVKWSRACSRILLETESPLLAYNTTTTAASGTK